MNDTIKFSDFSEDTTQPQPSQVLINMQYTKDLSFENPNAPMSYTNTNTNTAPKVEVNLDVGVKSLQENVYEVALRINASAAADNNTLFVVELTYAGVFTLVNIASEQTEFVLLVHCPTLIFPFARRIVADVTRDGGFQPLMIEPVDFNYLFISRQNQENKTVANA